MARGFFHPAAPGAAERVVAAVAHRFGLQPIFLHQPKASRADQPLVHLQRCQQLDQAAHGRHAAARVQGVAKHRHDERTGLLARLILPAAQAFGDGVGKAWF